jgi:predicted TIM-barrel fold metal-dependent hydrolase
MNYDAAVTKAGESYDMKATTGAASTVKTPVNFDIPRDACDCHVHVFDPAHFSYDSERVYTPPEASLDDLRNLQAALGFDRVVIVAPSVYGTDNSCTIDAVRQLGARARGVVVLDNSVTTTQLDDMAAVGVRGVRVNLESTQDTDATTAKRALNALAEKLRGRDWHVQFDTRLSVIKALKDEIASLPVPVVFSHFGRARAALGTDQPGFDDLIELVKTGRVYVKISAPDRTSDRRPDFPDVAPLARAIVEANADRVLWASNWPHPGRAATPTAIAPPCPNDDGGVLNLLPTWVPDPTIRRTILVDNPARLYRFKIP